MGFTPGSGAGSSSIAGSSDVALDSLVTKHVLSYDGTSTKWQNASLAGTAALATGGGQETLWANYDASGAVTLDLANGNAFRISPTGNVALTFTGATNNQVCGFTIYLKKTAGSETISWPSTVWWPGGVEPTLSTTPDAYDILVFESVNGGSIWFGALVGTDFKPAA